MAYKNFKPANEGDYVEYSAKHTHGTEWAKKHVQETFKRRTESGKLVMLTPPPLPYRGKR